MGKSAWFSRSSANKGRQNAMVSIGWFSGIAETLLLVGILGAQDTWIKIACVILFVGVLGFYGYVYNYFMRNDPDRLQTEGYNLMKHEMTLLGSVDSAVTVKPIGNTQIEGSVLMVEDGSTPKIDKPSESKAS